jgi:hypothetical protein
MTTDASPPRMSPWVVVLLGLRFLLELALWASFTVAAVRLVDGPAGWVIGLLATAAATVVWGLLLSPRRPIRLPLVARVAIEFALFAAAAALLAASGLSTAAVVLVVAELVVLGLLQGPDKHAV